MAMLTMVRSSSVMKRPRLSTASAAIGCRRIAFTVSVLLWWLGVGPAILRLDVSGAGFTPVPGVDLRPLEFTLWGPAISDASAHRPRHLFDHLRPFEAPVPQLFDGAPEPLELRPSHGLCVLLLDREKPRQIRRQLPQERVGTCDLGPEQCCADLEDLDRLLLAAKRAKEHERCPKARILGRRLFGQLTQPGLELIRPGPCEAVDRPLGPTTV